MYPNFYFQQPNRMITREESVVISWEYYGGEDPTAQRQENLVYGVRLIMATNDLRVTLLNIGFNDTVINLNKCPTSIELVFASCINRSQGFTPIIFIGEIWVISKGLFLPDNNQTLIIYWSPNNYLYNIYTQINIPSYVYVLLILLGAVGIVAFVLYRVYSCDNNKNIGSSRCYRSLLTTIRNIEIEKKIINEKVEKELINKIDLGEM